MIYKIILILSGVDFLPDSILQYIKGEYAIASKNNPQDKKHKNKEDDYGFGSISFFHPKKFATQPNILNYEQWFINFLLDNYELFKNYGVEDYELFFEVYHDEEQCNFEIFDKILLQKISGISISFPVSVYSVKKDEFQHWVSEIDTEWHNR
jgi:hypothetical protein